jgi:hypothetical protein
MLVAVPVRWDGNVVVPITNASWVVLAAILAARIVETTAETIAETTVAAGGNVARGNTVALNTPARAKLVAVQWPK